MGAGVLKRFNIIFDYGRQQLIFTKNANDAQPDSFDRAGMWLNLAEGGFEVMDVYAGSPAAEAGIKVGDRIVAVDSQPAANLTLPALRLRLRTDAPGTRVRLTLRSGAARARGDADASGPRVEAPLRGVVDSFSRCAPVAQLDRASASGAEGYRFEPYRAYQ